ncbi:MAG: carbohydrate ABC transporter permease [Thermomicrobiales bacterium]|nr:carbohydrate ABC transporter permease [Thermomicrobiales bacterium]MCO5225910.1 carbohydrate ABC transporter permease [Thermomicrobiales bacterium]
MQTTLPTGTPPSISSLSASAQKSVARNTRRRKLSQIALVVILLLGGLMMIFPFVWMISSSFKRPQDLYSLSLIPPVFTLDSYRTVLNDTSYVRWFTNSLIIATITTISVAFFDSLAGYTLAKFKFPGVTIIFVLILSTLMVPTEMLVIPWFMMSIELHWTNSYWGVMFPGVISAFGVFLMRQFFMGVPNELLDAARLDGFNEFQIFWKIALPLVKPALAALCIFTFLGNWNAYIWPLIVIRSEEMRTLPVGVAFFSSENQAAFDLIMAAASLATVPVIIIFLIFQKQIIKGIALAGLKG